MVEITEEDRKNFLIQMLVKFYDKKIDMITQLFMICFLEGMTNVNELLKGRKVQE